MFDTIRDTIRHLLGLYLLWVDAHHDAAVVVTLICLYLAIAVPVVLAICGAAGRRAQGEPNDD